MSRSDISDFVYGEVPRLRLRSTHASVSDDILSVQPEQAVGGDIGCIIIDCPRCVLYVKSMQCLSYPFRFVTRYVGVALLFLPVDEEM
jgi:hypothetical protein